MMQIESLTTNDQRWTSVLSRLDHDFYHLPQYVQLEAKRLNATPEAILVEDGEQLFFVPYLVRCCSTLFSEMETPFYDAVSPYGYPGILISHHGRNPDFAAQGLNALRQTLAERGVSAAFLRMNPILGENFAALFPKDFFYDSSQTVIVDLEPNESELRKQVRRALQQTLKKCSGLGYTAQIVSLLDVIDPFVEIYQQTMDRVQAKDSYYFGRDYFVDLAHLPGVHCCTINSGSTIVAACVLFECDGLVNTHLGGTRAEFLSSSPFTMAMFESILWAKSRGNRCLQLGGGVGGREDSLLHFKTGFSDKRKNFHTSRMIIDERKYHQLVSLAAQASGKTPEKLLTSNFFPAYRS